MQPSDIPWMNPDQASDAYMKSGGLKGQDYDTLRHNEGDRRTVKDLREWVYVDKQERYIQLHDGCVGASKDGETLEITIPSMWGLTWTSLRSARLPEYRIRRKELENVAEPLAEALLNVRPSLWPIEGGKLTTEDKTVEALLPLVTGELDRIVGELVFPTKGHLRELTGSRGRMQKGACVDQHGSDETATVDRQSGTTFESKWLEPGDVLCVTATTGGITPTTHTFHMAPHVPYSAEIKVRDREYWTAYRCEEGFKEEEEFTEATMLGWIAGEQERWWDSGRHRKAIFRKFFPGQDSRVYVKQWAPAPYKP